MAPRPALDRILKRPNLSDWGEYELITFAEAVALLFPDGPLSTTTLHSLQKRGELEFVKVCGKSYTSINSVRKLVAVQIKTSKSKSVAALSV